MHRGETKAGEKEGGGGEPSLLEVSVRSFLTVLDSESFGLNFPCFFIGPGRRDVQIRRHCTVAYIRMRGSRLVGTWIKG
jgi:hypothetical protein